MADRSISVKLRAEVDQYRRAMDDAAKSTEKVGTSAESTSKKADGALSKMMRSAQENREAWSTVGTTLVAAGGAVAAFGVAALKTGIEYNTLQQTSRAALTSLLGSARAANDQMDKLDAFAKKSPFSKSTFIQAQQQMLAFGIETRKVIPYLDAVQNAVAAAGGSNADIEGIVATMSKVQSSAKITAEDLNELGNRGVNAAELIGSQMGMTGAEIRDAISNGSLDATQALDALAAGMSERFAGAADNVKNTFAGATDRVKAAWRDFASELATPLVDPEGGGALVDFLNGIADAMRGFENLPDPLKESATLIGGVGGAAALAAGSFLLLAPRVADTVDAFRRAAPEGSKLRGVLGGLGKAAGVATGIYAVAVATGALVDALTRGEQAIGNNSLQKAIRETVDAGDGLAGLDVALSNTGTVLGMARVEAGSLTEAFDQMLNPSVTDRVSGFFDGIPGVTGYMEKLEERVSAVDAALSSMADTGDADTVQALMDMFSEAGYSAEELATLLPQTTDALVGVTAETEKAAESSSTLAGWQQRLAEQLASVDPAIATQAEALQTWIGSIDGVAQSFTDFSDDLGEAEFSLDGWLAKLEEQATALETWSANIQALVDKGASRELLQTLIDQGPAAAQAVQALANGTEEDLARAEGAFGRTQGAADGLKNKLGESYVLDIQTEQAEADVFDFASVFRQTGEGLAPWQVKADGTPAKTEAEGTRNAISSMKPNPFNLTADPFSANQTANVFTNTKRRTTVDIFGNTSPADTAISALSNRTVTIGVFYKNQNLPGAGTVLAPGGFTGGQVGAIAGYADGGRLPGVAPANPMQDNLLAMTERGRPIAVRSREWIVSQPASDHYGDRIMAAINSRRVPREVLSGYASGGVPMPVGNGGASAISSQHLDVAATAYFTDEQVSVLARAVRDSSRASATSAIRTAQSRRESR